MAPSQYSSIVPGIFQREPAMGMAGIPTDMFETNLDTEPYVQKVVKKKKKKVKKRGNRRP